MIGAAGFSVESGSSDARRARLARPWLVLAGCCFSLGSAGLGGGSFAAESTPPEVEGQAESEFLLRRIFVPAENLAAWPLEGQKYLPVEAAEFEAWIRTRSETDFGSAATIRRAEYFGRLEGDRLRGHGTWTIHLHKSKPAFLPLGPASLVPHDARWREAPERAARLGIWAEQAAPPGVLGLEVPQSGVLEFTWSVPARAVPDGLEIPWRLPTASTSRLTLELPEGSEPQIEGALIAGSHRVVAPLSGIGESRRLWDLMLQPNAGDELRIAERDDDPEHEKRLPQLSEQVRYRIARQGVEIESVWRLETMGSEPPELAVPLPRDVSLISIAREGQELTWRTETQSDGQQTVARFEVPVVSPERAITISVTAWKPLLLDEEWRLPLLRPQDVFWSTGQLALSIANSLELTSLSLQGCIETEVEGVLNSSEETLKLAAFSPAAEVRLNLRERSAAATVRMAASLTMSEVDISGRLTSQWNVTEGSLHKLVGEVADGWSVEAVETIPPDALHEWFIDRRAGRQRLQIQLGKAARAERPLVVIVSGRQQRLGVQSSLPARTLRLMEWKGAAVETQVLSFVPSEPYVVETTGELAITAKESLGDFAKLLDGTTGRPFYDLLNAGQDAGIRLVPRRGQYEAEVWLNATYSRNELQEEHHVLVSPVAEVVGSVLVYSTVPLGTNARWTLADRETRLTATRIESNDPRHAGLPPDGELWLIRLPGHDLVPIEIVAATTEPWTEKTVVRLLALPEAVQQTGRVFVRADPNEFPELTSRNMRSIPLPVAVEVPTPASGKEAPAEPAIARPETSMRQIRAAFRYRPADCLLPGNTPELRLSPTSPQPLVVQHVELESFFQADGSGSHRATYHIHKEGGGSFAFQVPRDAAQVLIGVRVNGYPQQPGITPDGIGELATVHLAAVPAAARVAVSLQTRGSPLGTGSKLVAPLVQTTSPVLRGVWNLWLPEELRATGEHLSPSRALSWRERLFGPLGRPEGPIAGYFRSGEWFGRSPMTRLAEAPGAADPSDRPLAGWRAYRTTFVAEVPSPVMVAHQASSVWSAAAFLLFIAAGKWLRARSGEAFIAALAGAAIMCLLLPAAFVTIATGVFMGLLLSLVPLWRRRTQLTHASAQSWSRGSTVGMLVAICSLLLVHEVAAAPASPPGAPGRAADFENVLIPVDANGRPAGGKYYVRESLLRQFMHSAKEDPPGRWLIRAAVYEIDLGGLSPVSGSGSSEWRLVFEIEVLARDTKLVFPFVRGEAEWNGTAMLDGVPTPLAWEDSQEGCAIHCAEPGEYVLSIRCKVPVQEESGERLLRLAVPPLPFANVLLKNSPAPTALTINGSKVLGQVAGSSVAGVETQVAAAERVELRWPADALHSTNQGATRITCLNWLRVGLDQLDLETRFIFEDSAGQSGTLQLAVDPDWELVGESGDEPLGVLRAGADGRYLVQVRRDLSDSDQHVLVTRWRLKRGSRWGQLRLPPVELLSHGIVPAWLAISTDPKVECELRGGTAVAATANEFLKLWDEAAAGPAPQFVFQNIVQQGLVAVVRPRLVESQINEELHVRAGAQKSDVIYHADVMPGTAHRQRFGVRVPRQLETERIAAIRDGEAIPLRWSRPEPQRINIFFAERLDEEYRIALQGTIAAEESPPMRLPRITSQELAASTQHTQLYSGEDVQVEVEGLTQQELEMQVPLEPAPAEWGARPMAAYVLDQAAAERVRLKLTENRVKLSGPMMTSLAREAAGWSATLRLRARVEQGRLDALRLRVPIAWSGPYKVQSNIPAVAATARAGDQALVTLRFERPVQAGHYVELIVAGPLASAAAKLTAPEISAEPALAGARYVRVPIGSDAQRLSWSEIGVRPAEAPAELVQLDSLFASPEASPNVAPADSDVSMQTFEIIGVPARVSLQPPAPGKRPATIRLAECSATAGAQGGLLVSTRFIIVPNGMTTCVVQVPRGQMLIDVRLEDHSLVTRRLGENRIEVPLGPGTLPRLLEVQTRSDRADRLQGGFVERPLIFGEAEPIPVELSLWSVNLDGAAFDPGSLPGNRLTPAEYTLLRFERLVSIAEAAMSSAVEAEVPDGYHWFLAWARLLTSLEQEAVESSRRSAPTRALQVATTGDDQVASAAQRLIEWISSGSDLLVLPGLELPSDALGAGQGGDGTMPVSERRPICFIAEGGLDRFQIPTERPASIILRRVSLVTAIVALAAAGAWLIRWERARDMLVRWPQAVMFLIGIGYWACLGPSWFGLLLAAAAVFLAMQTGWQRPAPSAEGSTVLRVSRT